MIKTKDKPAEAVEALRPYVKRAMDDPDLREDLLAAFVAARSLYGQLADKEGVKAKAEKVTDKSFQKELQALVSDLSDASDRLKSDGSGHKTRNRVILLTGVTLGVLYNPWTGQATRDWIMSRIAGDDGFEEFGDTLSSEAGNGSEPPVTT
jgi:mevalonate pyrophosphate decarboxylase